MPALQAEVVGQHMAIQLLAQLSAERTTTGTTGQAAEDGPGHSAEGDANGASDQTNSCSDLTASDGGAGTASCTAGSTDSGTDLHGCP